MIMILCFVATKVAMVCLDLQEPVSKIKLIALVSTACISIGYRPGFQTIKRLETSGSDSTFFLYHRC